jgi:hypothetical protein
VDLKKLTEAVRGPSSSNCAFKPVSSSDNEFAIRAEADRPSDGIADITSNDWDISRVKHLTNSLNVSRSDRVGEIEHLSTACDSSFQPERFGACVVQRID